MKDKSIMSNFKATYKPGMFSQPKLLLATPKRYSLYGQFGSGKTRTAATLSKYFPQTVPAPEPVILHDMVWVAAEDGLATLAALNIHPKYVLNMIEMQQRSSDGATAADALQAADWIEKELTYIRNNDPEVDICVVDTVTAFNASIVDAWFAKDEKTNVETSGKPNPQRTWGKIGSTCNGFFNHIQILGFKSVWLAHPGENQDLLVSQQSKIESSVQESRSASNIARTSIHGGPIEMAMQGGFRKTVNGSVDINFWLTMETKNGKTRRVLKHLGDSMAGGKSRFEHILADSEEPNLLAIETKIKNWNNKQPV